MILAIIFIACKLPKISFQLHLLKQSYPYFVVQDDPCQISLKTAKKGVILPFSNRFWHKITQITQTYA
jgi:hypothetical protein